MAWILENQSMLGGLLSEPGYLAPFLVLVLCGFGLPVPEEITMLGAGFLLYQGEVDMAPIIAVCLAGTLLGDSVPFFIGRRFGRRALQLKAIRRVVHPERLRAIERRFDRQGALAVFVCRFIRLRLPTWFTAGTLGMPYAKFIAYDGLEPASSLRRSCLAASPQRLSVMESKIEELHQILGFVVLPSRRCSSANDFDGGRARRRTPDSAPARRPEPPPDGDRP